MGIHFRSSSLFTALLVVTGCGDDGASITNGETETETGTATEAGSTSATTLTTADPTSADTTTGADTTGVDTTTGLDETGDTDDTDGETCGNGEIDPREACDGENLGGMSCEREGYDAGSLSCTDTCSLDTSACCNDACTTEAATQCNGDVVEICSVGDNGCLEWTPETDCSQASEYCDETGGDATCLPVCIDQCNAAGDTQCDGDIIETCSVRGGEEGCLGWVSGDDCSANNQYCDASQGDAECVCDDECTTDGDLQCAENGDAVEVCEMAANGCLAWAVDTTCVGEDTCGVVDGTPACIAPLAYCIPSYATGCGGGDEIDDFIIHDSEQNTVFEHLGTGCSANAYGDFTQDPALLISLEPLTTYDFTATHNFGSQRVKIWIDFDLDGEFEDATELLFESPSSGNPTLGSFTIPGYMDLPLVTRMRVMDRWSSTPTDACDPGGSWGETHDYTVEILDTGETCETFSAKVTEQVPEHGATTSTLSPSVTAFFDTPISTNVGIITITGNMGTDLSYDLSTNPGAVTFSAGNTTMTVDPGLSFPPGEAVTVAWTGLVDALCANPVSAPAWTFDVIVPPCTPGEGDMLGTTLTQFPSGIGSFTEYYVGVDTDPNGWVYVGGTSALHRLPKGGGPLEIETVPGLGTTNLGYDMLIVGNDVFTIESKTSGTTGHLWRISTDGGTTWNVQDFATFPSVPEDDFRAAAHHDGRIYLATHEATLGVATEIWSVDLNAPPPVMAVLEGTVDGERNCVGIAVDDLYYYLACGTDNRLVRVDRITFAVELMTDAWSISTLAASLRSNDANSDGIADQLYLQSNDRRAFYVCDPAGVAYTDLLTTYGTSTTTNYGMDFDPLGNVLWTYHDSLESFVSIE
jgi:hypothetical protein